MVPPANNEDKEALLGLLTSRFWFRRRPPSKKEMERFWADSRENDKEVSKYFSRLNEGAFALPFVGAIDRSEDSVRLAVGAGASTALFGLFRDPPVIFCYLVEDDESHHIHERVFSPLTECRPEPTLKVGLCTFKLGPPEAFANIPELRVWNAILESVPPCDTDLAKKLLDLPPVSFPENLFD